jgi:hypothetical protein
MLSPCQEVENALRNGKDELPEKLMEHVLVCPGCSATLNSWKDLSDAAPSLRKTWESPDLWPGISLALSETTGPKPGSACDGSSRWNFPFGFTFWKPAFAGLCLLLLGLGIVWAFLYRSPTAVRTPGWFLSEQTLKEVEATEQAYVRSIEKLTRLVPQKPPKAESSLFALYSEKLMVIDDAIASCRSQIERNRYNAYLRRELLAMYREKQNTLQEILKEDRYVEK